jgi:catechol 2,3-dioxygenase-like lactoylglutathione lyase family enzyme
MAIDFNPENSVISVGVSDYDRSLAWYRDVLGFETVYELADYGWCELRTPFGFNIGLGQTETVEKGNVTPTFGVHDIDAAIAHLRERDVQVEDWHEVPGMVRLSTFYDPDGTPWMFAQVLVDKETFGREGAPAASTSSGSGGE